jgi:hypothetical protein
MVINFHYLPCLIAQKNARSIPPEVILPYGRLEQEWREA